MTPSPSRGAHILDAAAELVAEQGVSGLSMRRVATAAEISLAQVQYYFRTKADLVGAVFDRAGEQFLTTLAPTLAGEPSLHRLRSIVWQWLPLDVARERRARIWLAYAAVAVTDTKLAEASAGLDAQLRDWFTEQLNALHRVGLLDAGVDPITAAGQLLALVDGVTVHSLILPMPDRGALADRCLGDWLNQLVPADHATAPSAHRAPAPIQSARSRRSLHSDVPRRDRRRADE